jgi:hypothetical protein
MTVTLKPVIHTRQVQGDHLGAGRCQTRPHSSFAAVYRVQTAKAAPLKLGDDDVKNNSKQ